MPSARKYITGPETVEVQQFKQLTADLGAMTYLKEIGERTVLVADCFNVPSEAVMDILLHVDDGKIVHATIAPDRSDDNDGHPEVNSAVIDGEK